MFISISKSRGVRGHATIHRHMYKTGCTLAGHRLWTADEDAKVKEHHPNVTLLCQLLPHRSMAAIKHRANGLGCTSRRNFWKPLEIRTMQPPYVGGVAVAEIEKELPGRDKRQIYGKASHLRLRRPRRAPMLTGLPILDLVRRHAFAERISMAELDVWTGSKYFSAAPRHYNWNALERALIVLGGRLVVEWPS